MRRRVRLLANVTSLSGKEYEAEDIVEVWFDRDGIAVVIGAGYLPLAMDEWEFVA